MSLRVWPAVVHQFISKRSNLAEDVSVHPDDVASGEGTWRVLHDA